jgi:hypothetical protein
VIWNQFRINNKIYENPSADASICHQRLYHLDLTSVLILRLLMISSHITPSIMGMKVFSILLIFLSTAANAFLSPSFGNILAMKKDSLSRIEYRIDRRDCNDKDQHHPRLQQSGSVFESKIQRVFQKDFDCPLLSRKIHGVTDSGRDSSILPMTIDSLSPDLVDMDDFTASMSVQIRQRVPSFNSRGYQSTIISDLKKKSFRKVGKSSHLLEGTPIMMTRFNTMYPLTKGLTKPGRNRLAMVYKKLRDKVSAVNRVLLLKASQWLLLAILLQRMWCHGLFPGPLDLFLL